MQLFIEILKYKVVVEKIINEKIVISKMEIDVNWDHLLV
jgi:hypothetical protein